MNDVDLRSQEMSEDEALNSEKLVPVSEAIRYRKRAQQAEKQSVTLEQQLNELLGENKQLTERLNGVELEQKLVGVLSVAGVNDLEAAVLVAKARMKSEEDLSVESIVEQLRKEKAYLFDDQGSWPTASKTAGVKERKPGGQRVLEKTAKRAAISGSRNDVQEYMKVRRQFV